ncbi:PP2C family protein-serine/threonine phosphatase [Amycolatopsis regifaucium]|uniref:Serine/threonine protein phosphatase n=1 Tax=Amycolatopsis regifaucium TaxID=546365 RepID=A0A154MFD0_9PSEU|nr:protein phosphatase 2C domain-containing protein [Amycolatopsis regifaucium]KZB82913.1 serine/threonine protein phosphatase [Amycolatopsis regifaucium]OKA03379.1 serine/threonine protein phosphatase [Amycolatopsis regifaucium]SFJ68352.1 protein phosphatase [Amycolatopsis regifaucium]
MRDLPHWHTASAQGPRKHNADAAGTYAAADGTGIVFALADGVGDHPNAAYAARTAVSAATRTAAGRGAVATVLAAQGAVLASGGPGDCVLVVAVRTDEGYGIAWVGDARAYAWDGYSVRQVTKDHTLAQYFRDHEQPVTPRMEHVVTTSVRTAGEHEIGTATVTTGGLLLTSDGVHKTLSGPTMLDILAMPDRAATELVRTAISLGGSDNATAIVVGPPGADLTTEKFRVAA